MTTESPAFRQWFDDSKVVDDTGKPLVVYHGTASEFTEFDLSKTGRNYGEGEHAFFFTDRKSSADNYAILHAGDRGTPKTLSVYLSIKNPYISRAPDYHAAVDRYDASMSADVFSLQADGYDGVIINSPTGSLYVAFEPSQIKSANDNSEALNPENSDIRKSLPASSACQAKYDHQYDDEGFSP